MKNIILILIAASCYLLMMSECRASSELPPALQVFERSCLRGHENCVYERIRFESADKASRSIYSYKLLNSKYDVIEYNKYISGILNNNIGKNIDKFVVKHYDIDAHDWTNFHGTKKCKFCLNSNEKISINNKEWIRIELKYQISSNVQTFISFGEIVYKGQSLRIEINVTAPRFVNPTDMTPIYIDSRMKGVHGTISFTCGGITLDLDGNSVPDFNPDYVVISTQKSWYSVGIDYMKFENNLLEKMKDIPRATNGSIKQRLDKIAHALHAYQLRYDDRLVGTFPSIAPQKLIANGRGDCRALATLADALFKASGVEAHVVALNERSRPPVSFNVPGPFWSPLHAILYIPKLDTYIDPTLIATAGVDWKISADVYRGATALDMTTGTFVVVH